MIYLIYFVHSSSRLEKYWAVPPWPPKQLPWHERMEEGPWNSSIFQEKPIWWNVARSNSLQSRQIWILSSTELKWAILPHYQRLLSRVWYRILKGWTVLPPRHLWESHRSSLFLEMVLPAHHFHCDSASECYLSVIKIGKLYATDSPKRQEHTWSKRRGWKYFMFTSSTQTAKVIGAVTTINIVGWCVTSPFSPVSFYQKTELASIFY